MWNSLDWSHSFARALTSLTSGITGPPELARFWLLFAGGLQDSAGTWFWLKTFRHFYILHMLVLSGTQVEALARFGRVLFQWTFSGQEPRDWARHVGCLQFGVSGICLAFAAATQWSAPITRATLVSVLALWFPRLAFWPLACFAGLLQWLLFAHHRGELGFYLSWIAYLVVVASAQFRVPSWQRALLVSAILFVIVDTVCLQNPFQIRAFLLCLAANVVVGWVLEKVFLPFATIMIVLALFLAVGNLTLPLGGEFLALWTMPLVEALLVVLKTLMYT